MTIISWTGGKETRIFKSSAEKFISALIKRGHKKTLDYTSIDGTRYITFAK